MDPPTRQYSHSGFGSEAGLSADIERSRDGLIEGGVALYAVFELDIGDRVEVELTDPDSGPHD
jgi:hypothetical protein